MIEHELLKQAAIEEKVIANSGKTLQELHEFQLAQCQKAIARLDELQLPTPWIQAHPNVKEIERQPGGRVYRVLNSKSKGFSKSLNALTVICSIGIKSDDKLWLHLSVSGQKFPVYSDLVLVKNIFIGEDKTAIQVFPGSENHVNDHANCLHLWHCLEQSALPEFSLFGTI